jgi:hypothetical protein
MTTLNINTLKAVTVSLSLLMPAVAHRTSTLDDPPAGLSGLLLAQMMPGPPFHSGALK